MKYVLLAIFVLIAAQPLQATSCDMHDDQSASHSQHDGMQHDAAANMDCCDSDADESDAGCDSMTQCSTCPTALGAIRPSLVTTIFLSGAKQYLADSNTPTRRSTAPPFRPPIS